MSQAAKQKCPICGKASAEKIKPFCSARCATIDLGRWLGEEYRVPDTGNPDEDVPSLSDEDEG